MSDARAFFGKLYEGIGAGFIEIRPFTEPGAFEKPPRRWFSWPKEVGLCTQFCSAINGQAHVYFGVGLRTRIGGGAKEDVGCVTAFFADIDYKDLPREEVEKKICVFPKPPSVEIQSGNGVHLYWFLNEPVFKSRFEFFEEVNLGILRYFGAQEGTQNADRILRVPDTKNIKAHYPDPKPVCAVSSWFPDRRYSLSDFDFIRAKPRELFHSNPIIRDPVPESPVPSSVITTCAGMLAPLWIHGIRHYFTFHLGGWCAHAGIALDSAEELVREICQKAQDEEIPNRIETVRSSYAKHRSGEAVTGRPLLFDFFAKNFDSTTAAYAAAFTEILKSHMPGREVERTGCFLNQENS